MNCSKKSSRREKGQNQDFIIIIYQVRCNTPVSRGFPGVLSVSRSSRKTFRDPTRFSMVNREKCRGYFQGKTIKVTSAQSFTLLANSMEFRGMAWNSMNLSVEYCDISRRTKRKTTENSPEIAVEYFHGKSQRKPHGPPRSSTTLHNRGTPRVFTDLHGIS